MKVLITLLVLNLGQTQTVEIGNASIFGTPGDKWAGGPAACPTRINKRRVHQSIKWHRQNKTLGIAHRTLPCGTRVRVTLLKTGRSVIARVVDRGPYGACTAPKWHPSEKRCPPGRWVVKKRREDPGTWRSVADLLPATAAALGHRGGLRTITLTPVFRRHQ